MNPPNVNRYTEKVRQKPRAIKTKLYPFGVQVAAEKEQNAGEATCWPDVKSQTPNRKIRS